MDTFETKTPDQSASNDLPGQVESVRDLIVKVLILVIVVSGTLNIFFLRQLRDAHRQLTQIRPQAQKMMETYQKTEAPMMQAIVNRFTDYGRTHPDYAPILSKYNIKAAAPTAAPMAAPPATTPEKK